MVTVTLPGDADGLGDGLELNQTLGDADGLGDGLELSQGFTDAVALMEGAEEGDLLKEKNGERAGDSLGAT
jgi:hypothetical protein